MMAMKPECELPRAPRLLPRRRSPGGRRGRRRIQGTREEVVNQTRLDATRPDWTGLDSTGLDLTPQDKTRF